MLMLLQVKVLVSTSDALVVFNSDIFVAAIGPVQQELFSVLVKYRSVIVN